MPSGFRIAWYGDSASSRLGHEAGDAVHKTAEFLLSASNRTVPIEEGTLERSGHADSDGQGKATVSYDTPYARRQHEEMNYRHDPGRRAKWLEMTFLEEEGAATEYLASRLGRAF